MFLKYSWQYVNVQAVLDSQRQEVIYEGGESLLMQQVWTAGGCVKFLHMHSKCTVSIRHYTLD